MLKTAQHIFILSSVLLAVFSCCGLTVSAASLFDVTDKTSPWYSEDAQTETGIESGIETESGTQTKTELPFAFLPDYALSEDGKVLINDHTTLDEVTGTKSEAVSDINISSGMTPGPTSSSGTVSGGNASSGFVTYSDIETIVSEALAESLADSRAANLSVADAYLSSAIVDVFSRVVDGYPSYYKYAAYRLSSTDNNEGYLLIGWDARVNGNYLEFNSGSHLCHYYRVQYSNGYQTYYSYKYDVTEIYDTFRIPYNTGQLIYTNMVSGFPALSEMTHGYIASFLIPLFIVSVCLFVVFRRKK